MKAAGLQSTSLPVLRSEIILSGLTGGAIILKGSDWLDWSMQAFLDQSVKARGMDGRGQGFRLGLEGHPEWGG